jgi:hypothetical protein
MPVDRSAWTAVEPEKVMEKVLKIVGVILLVWIAFSIVGAVVGFLAHVVLWVALIAGGVAVVGAIAGRNRRSINRR